MRVIIAGSREVKSYDVVEEAIKESGFAISQVVSGMASGVDALGVLWAKENDVLLAEYPADWKRYGRAAGMIRNKQMSENADALVAIWDGKSHGTQNMIGTAKAQGLMVYVKQV